MLLVITQQTRILRLKQRQLQHINKQQNTTNHRHHKRLIHQPQIRHHNNTHQNQHKHQPHRYRPQPQIRRILIIRINRRLLIRFDPLRKNKSHHTRHKGTHNDEEEHVGGGPFVDAEGVEGAAVFVAPDSVFVDFGAHVPGEDGVIDLVGGVVTGGGVVVGIVGGVGEAAVFGVGVGVSCPEFFFEFLKFTSCRHKFPRRL
mmetsp:Transcript_26271/g.31002  ORF Transcript_26271/g.31002 Transcript_26271/m.31002 type:complete len:201 (+) Transcript_26271:249-851(+)